MKKRFTTEALRPQRNTEKSLSFLVCGSVLALFYHRFLKRFNLIPSVHLSVLSVSVLIFLFAGCEKRKEWTLQSQQSNTIIVDGTFTDETKSHIIKLSFPVTQLNETPKPVSGATVILSDGNNWNYELAEDPANTGIYRTDTLTKGVAGQQYSLFISYKGNVYTAKSEMLAGNSFQVFQYSKNNNNLCRITRIASAYSASDFAIWEINLDWKHVKGYQNLPPEQCRARVLYYTLPTIDVSQVLAPAIEKIVFPVGAVFTEKRYSITREHAEFIRSLLSETNWQGGLFDSQHANLPTNLSAGAAGFFAACGVAFTPVQDTIR